MKKIRVFAASLLSRRPAGAAARRANKIRWVCSLILSVGTTGFASAQPPSIAAPAARNLVTTQVDASKRFILSGHRAAWAGAQNDQGAVPGDLELRNLNIGLNRSPEREQAFQQLLKDQQDPASPDYHRWLTPVEVGEQFGASQHDIDAVSAWLSAQGLHVDGVANSRIRLMFTGTSAAVARAFATPLHYYAVAGERRIANADDPQIPAALANVVQTIAGLRTLKFRPAHHMTQPQQSSAVEGATRPAATFCSGGTCSHYVFPTDFATIYDLPATYTGSGQSIAIVSKTRIYDADMTNFNTRSGANVASPTVIVPPNGTDPGAPATTCTTTGTTDTCANPSEAVGNQGEATLDVQRAGSVAPGATIKLIASADVGNNDGVVIGIEYAIDTQPVPANILSISYASCESDNGASASIDFDNLFQRAAVEGISVFVASGDGGVAGCEPLDSTPSTSQIVSTNTLCASGAVTCVGGTEFADSANPSAYWAASNGANFLSALGYIPEGAWNDPRDSSGNTQFSASGGGVSAYIATPSWQTGAGVPGTQGRYSPDVSFAASTTEGYFTCVAAQGGSCAVTNGSFAFLGSGGTSASTPSMAGIAAMLNQKTGSPQGNLNPHLYALAASPGNGVFHDVTVSSSGVAGCSLSTPSLCNNSTPGPTGLSGGLQGFQVGTGYDEVTGLGSIDVANLLNQWSATGPTVFNLDQHGLTGAWYNPATGGQGLLIETYPDLFGSGHGYLAAGWYTFDVTAAGGQRWYTVQGDAFNNGSAVTLKIYAASGGNFNAPPKITSAQVGTGTLSFSDCTHGTLNYNFNDGRIGSIPLIRLDANVTCTSAGDSGAATSNYLLSGAWYNSATSGQGLFFDVNPLQTLFYAAWYTYAPNGASIGGGASQHWYTIQDNAFAPGTVSKSGLAIYEPTGGTFNTPGGASTGAAVGSATVVINSCTSITLSYTFSSGTNAGQHGSISLARVVDEPAGCSL